jgi:5-methylcytosine-specific restriction protein A
MTFDSEAPWTKWYKHRRWKRMRLAQLAIEPLCAICKAKGKVEPATIVDHVEKHFGDIDKFWTGKLQSVCRQCHEVRKKFIESRGYDRVVGADGWPLDPKHPANLPREAFQRFGFSIPHHLRASAIPVTLVCGAPASGKTTWVDAHKRFGDTVISLDECKVAVGGRLWDTDRRILRRALAYRDAMLRSLANKKDGHAYVVIGGPSEDERDAWCRALGTSNVVVLDTPADVCIARINSDRARAHAVADLTNGVKRWHHLRSLPPRLTTPVRAASAPPVSARAEVPWASTGTYGNV